MKRNREIDILRGMAILMVLLYHSIIVYPVNLHDISWCRELYRFLWTVMMPLFFLVSGYCYSTGSGIVVYYKSRVKRILLPHIVFGLLDMVPRLIPNPLVNSSSEGLGNMEALLKDWLIYGGGDWFLRVLFIISVIFPLIVLVIDKAGERGYLAEIGFFVLFAAVYIFYDIFPDEMCLNLVAGFIFYFYAGYLLKRHRVDLSFSRPVNIIAILASAAFYIIYRMTDMRILELCFVICISIVCIGIARLTGGRLAGFTGLCGRNSLELYLLAPYALVLSRTLLVRILGFSSPVIIIGGNFVIDTLLALLMSLGAHKIINVI